MIAVPGPLPRPRALWLVAGAALLYASWCELRTAHAEAYATVAGVREEIAWASHVEQKHALEAEIRDRDVELEKQAARADAAEARATRAEARRPGLIERVVHDAGPDSAVVRVAVEEVRDSIVQLEVEPLKVTVSALREQLGLYQHSDATWATAYAAQGAALDLSRQEAAAWKKAAKGGGLLATAAKIAVGVGVGVVVEKVF